MKSPISDELFIDYLQCKHKAYLKQTDKIGIKHDWEKYQESRNDNYRQRARAFFQQNHKMQPNPPTTLAFVEIRKQKLSAATGISIINDNYNLTLDAIEISSQSSSRSPVYDPVIFSPHAEITKQDKLLLAFHAIALSCEQKAESSNGTIIHGDRYSSSRVQLPVLIKVVYKIEKELIKMMESKTMPLLRLTGHCKECEFQAGCAAGARDKDDLSLLKGLSEKEIETLNKRGIFTVTQYSYTFRPRRATRLQARNIIKHHHSLNALAIRTQTIYIADRQKIPAAKVNVYLDVEGIPEDNFYYLIGLLIDDGAGITMHSLWADSKADEKTIWESFLSIIGKYYDYVLFHYGSYEAKFVRKMTALYGGDSTLLDEIKARSYNVMSAIYGHIYFPTYSNDLKSIATFLGFKWSESDVSGLKSIIWRDRWKKEKDNELKLRLIAYNRDDCMALQLVLKACENLNNDEPSKELSCQTKHTDEIKPSKPLGIFKRNQFIFPELDAINKKAYWDYQRAKIYVRQSSVLRCAKKRPVPQIIKAYRVNRIVIPDRPKRCPKCNARRPMKHTHHTRIVIDLKMFNGGIKRWVTKYEIVRYMCKKCWKTFIPAISEQYSSLRYGSSLVAWVVCQSVGRLKSQSTIIDDLSETFDYRLSPSIIARFKERAAAEYTTMCDGLLSGIIHGDLLHIDETKISIKGANGYVWAIANMDNIVYLFNSSRETSMIKEKLNAFRGVLVSDFYTAYDSFCCPQQKCLIHLIRDINDDILKQPFDEELKSLGRELTMTLSPIIGTIDRYGLRRRHLSKYKSMVDSFYDMVLKKEYSSELAINYQRRFTRYREKLFTFMDYDGVPWNNNNAEHAIKRFVQLRKVIGGSSTEKGMREYLVMLSVCETLRLRNISFLKFLMSGAKTIEEYQMSLKNAA